MRQWTLQEALIYGKGTERPFLCPVHGDSRASASLNVIKQLWYCYSCGAHGGLTGEDALIEPDYEVMKTWFVAKVEENRVYPESWLERYASADHPYWPNRLGTAATARFRLGYDCETRRANYPLRSPAGDVLGVVGRLTEGDGPKYLYPKGVDIGRLLFNYTADHRPAVVLVEGAVDAMALWNIGVDAFAIYGAVISRAQVELIDRVDPDRVYIAFDNDEAGRRATWLVEQQFKHREIHELSWPLSWGKDVAELSEVHRRKVCAELVSTDVLCVESQPCQSPESMSSRPRLTIQRSRSTSTPKRLIITPRSD